MGGPDFIIAGAPRCGTTWLAKALGVHPEVAIARLSPEPKFFLVDEEYANGIEYYERYWSSGERRLKGEKSTNYMESSSACLRIKRHYPNVKILFVLRNPARRAYSNYIWSCLNDLEVSPTFREALELEEKRNQSLVWRPRYRYMRWWDYTGRGFYLAHMRQYLKKFDCHTIFYRQLVKSKAVPEVLNPLQEWLGLSTPLTLPETRYNETLPYIRAQDLDALQELEKRYYGANEALAKALGSDEPRRWNA